MEKYNLYVGRETLEKVKECATAHINHRKWLPVEVLSDLVGSDLSDIFGNGVLGWSPYVLKNYWQITNDPTTAFVSVPKPEELPHTTAPAGAYAVNTMYSTMRDAICFLRRWTEEGAKAHMPVAYINQLAEMRTLIHTLIGTGEGCCDSAVHDTADTIRKTTRLDAMDAFAYAIRAMLERKDAPGVKTSLNSVYGERVFDGPQSAEDVAKIDLEQMYPKELVNIKSDEPNALFITVDTGSIEVTAEKCEAINWLISSAGRGRDIHLRII